MSSKSKRRKSHVQQTGSRVLGLINYHGEKRPCGICGVTKRMSRAHVPPQCAGNQMLVKRSRFMVNEHEVDVGRQDLGGIHPHGLCAECNTQAGQYDEAYGDFAAALRPNWVKSWEIQVPPLISTPSVTFDPGAVARSIRSTCARLGRSFAASGPTYLHNWPANPRWRCHRNCGCSWPWRGAGRRASQAQSRDSPSQAQSATTARERLWASTRSPRSTSPRWRGS